MAEVCKPWPSSVFVLKIKAREFIVSEEGWEDGKEAVFQGALGHPMPPINTLAENCSVLLKCTSVRNPNSASATFKQHCI